MTISPGVIEDRWRFYSVVRAGPMRGRIRDEIPMLSCQITERLKGVGSISGTLPLYHPSVNRQNLDTENTVLVAERDGVIMAAGPFLTVSLDQGGETVSVRSDGPWRILRDRVIRGTQGMTYASLKAGEVRFDQVDQFRIVQDLVDHVNTIHDTGITVEWTNGLSGIERDRSYEADKAKSVGEAIEQLSDVIDGFDWAIEVGGSAQSVTMTLRLSYPFRGRDTGYRFEIYGGTTDLDSARLTGSSNVLAAGLTETSENRVSRFTAIGPGEGESQLLAHASDPSLDARLPVIERGGSWMDVTRQRTLQQHADRALQLDSRASRTPSLTVDPNAEPRLGAYIVGDIAHVTIDDGWAQYDDRARIISRTINVGADGSETVDLEFAELGRFGIG